MQFPIQDSQHPLSKGKFCGFGILAGQGNFIRKLPIFISAAARSIIVSKPLSEM